MAWCKVAHIVKETDSPIVVVGHSLEGLSARFLSAHFPGTIRRVVILSFPSHGSLRATHPFVWLAFRTLRALWVNGPWSYTLSELCYAPEVTAAVRAIAADEISEAAA